MSRRTNVRTATLGLALGLAALVLTGLHAQTVARDGDAPLPERIQFNRDIRPILSDKCFTCHGPDRSRRVTSFRFDVEETVKQDLGGGRFVVAPGSPDTSVLVQRITATDDRRRMPPVSSGRSLSAREIALLKAWIQQGAAWEKHWAFQPPSRPALPVTADRSWVRNPIDNFVLQRLEQEHLGPSAPADRSTLLRRVTLDLTGKGPTIAEQNAFLADASPDAYEKVVARLLRSPHYGERMAIPWLDAARYSDSAGYQADYERFMWRWRDWVIDAFNRNQPYDQFTIEQIAGDLLPNATLDQKIATAFNRNHRTNEEAGVIPAEYAVEYVVDRVATTSTVFLGLTAGCARCHDHKYDPISQKEFYQLFAYFNNVPELGSGDRGNSRPRIKAPTTAQATELARLDRALARVTAQLARVEPQIAHQQNQWMGTLGESTPDWAPTRGLIAHYPLDAPDRLQGMVKPPKPRPAPRARPAGDQPDEPTTAALPDTALQENPPRPPALVTQAAAVAAWKGAAQFAPGVAGHAARFDGSSVIEAGDVGDFGDDFATELGDKFSLSAWFYPTAATGAILTKTVDRAREKGYLLQLKDGRAQMSIAAFDNLYNAVAIESLQPVALNRWHHVAVTYGGTRVAPDLALYVDGRRQEVRVLVDFLTLSPSIREPLRIGGGGGVENRFQGLIDEVRVYDVELTPTEVGLLFVAKSIAAIAAVPSAQRTAEESGKARSAFLASDAVPAPVRALVTRLETLRDQRTKFYDSISTVSVMEETPQPRQTHLLQRGAYDQPGEAVAPGVPQVLPPMPPQFPQNRLGLARWLVSPANPLTARVAVNRFWQMYFGTGLVKTLDDFGSQGDAPSHPELLDWLATEFVRTGWDVKALQRLIVTSATYRQSSKATPELLQRDRDNRLLARGARFRLPAETVRDQALAVSGLLVEQVGGPSVRPYQPAGLWAELTNNERYVQDRGDSLYRRSLYTFWKRTITPPSMSNFDAPTRESCVVQRGATNSPLQALDLMNDVTYLEAARMLAQRMLTTGGSSVPGRLTFAMRLATGRAPNDDEMRTLSGALDYALGRFRARPDAARQFLAVGEHTRDERLDPRELAGYASVASLILNLDRTITRE